MTTTNNSFLPSDYEIKENAGRYFRIQDWESVKIRILGNSVIGWEYFKEKDWKSIPVRSRKPYQWVPADSKNGDAPKEFWAFCVYNYTAERLQIWEVTQNTIKKVLFNLNRDPDFGDPKTYDLKITREWKGLETKYQIVPLNKTEFTNKAVLEELKKVNVEELFEWWDPFNPQPF